MSYSIPSFQVPISDKKGNMNYFEKYWNFSEKSYCIVAGNALSSNKIYCKKNLSKNAKIARNISLCTLIIPILMLIGKAFYRAKHAFFVMDESFYQEYRNKLSQFKIKMLSQKFDDPKTAKKYVKLKLISKLLKKANKSK